MDCAALESLVEWLRTEYPEQLRAVVVVDGRAYRTLHVRPDVHDRYTDEDRSEIAQDVTFEELPDVHGSSLYDLGNQRATLRVFEEGTVLVAEWGDRDLLVTLDAEADVHVREFVDDVFDRLPTATER